MRISFYRSFGCFWGAANLLAVLTVLGEMPQTDSGEAESIVSDPSVQWEEIPSLKVDTSSLRYYSSPYWHENRFGALYVLSKDKQEARVALEQGIRFFEDAAQLPVRRVYYDLLLCQSYARLAWMAKVEGNEPEFQRLVGQSVFWLRRWRLLERGVHNDPSRWPTELQAAKTQALTDTDLYDTLYMVLALDRHAKAAWLSQSDYDFEGFIETLDRTIEPSGGEEPAP